MTDRQAILAFALARHGLHVPEIGEVLNLNHLPAIEKVFRYPMRGYSVPRDWTPPALQQEIDHHLRLANVRGQS